MAIEKGDLVVTTKPITNREAYFESTAQPGTRVVSVPSGTRLRAATDEIGGNVWVWITVSNDDLLLPFAQGEWQPG